MAFKSPVWFPIAVLVSLGNLIAAWVAARQFGSMHATVHAVLAVGAGLWAYSLRKRRGAGKVGPDAIEALDALEALEGEMVELRQQLSEAQQRVELAERRLPQAEPRKEE
jgi:hypothetical protein